MHRLTLIAVAFVVAALAATSAEAACRDEMAIVARKLPDITDQAKRAETEEHLRLADQAAQTGNEPECMKHLESARKASK